MRSFLHAMRSETLGLLALALAIFAFGNSNLIQAQQAPNKEKLKASTQETPTTKKSAAIEIKLETFRKQFVPGNPMGVIADITNNSSGSIYMRQQDVQLVLPVEVDIRNTGSTEGWFPTEYSDPHVISLKQNETYRVFFARAEGCPTKDEKSPKVSKLRRWLQSFNLGSINFTPGTYPITVEAKYWENDQFHEFDYHTAVEAKTGEFTAPQWVILLGAALGGLLFAVISMVRAEQSSENGDGTGPLRVAKAWTKGGAKLLGSILLSLIVTILLSRIAETQFFIKVSVSDFWGAIAIGFLANYGGWALLDKMVPGEGGDGAKNKNQPKTGPVVPAHQK